MNYGVNKMKSKPSNILYINNLQSIIKETDKEISYIQPNSIIVTSHNPGEVIKNHRRYKGNSYEMFYIDGGKKLQRLSYNVQEGAGLDLSSYYLYLGTDNKTIKATSVDKNLYIDNEEIQHAYYNYKGVVMGDNELYYDQFYETTQTSGTVSTVNGIVSLNPGVMLELREMEYYYSKFFNLDENIKLIIDQLVQGHLFKVGDILYKNDEGDLSPKKLDGYKAFMVCIIASNTHPDTYPRFIPIVGNGIYYKQFSNDESDTFHYPVRFAYNNIPIFNIDYAEVTSESQTVASSYGYMATNQSNWNNSDHYINALNSTERYGVGPNLGLNSYIPWYLLKEGVNYNQLYVLEERTIFTERIEAEDDSTPPETIVAPIVVEFDDGFKGYYDIEMSWEGDQYFQSNIAFPKEFANQASPKKRTTISSININNCRDFIPCDIDTLLCSSNLAASNNIYSSSNNNYIDEVPDDLQLYIRSDEEANLTNIDFDRVFGVRDVYGDAIYWADDRDRYIDDVERFKTQTYEEICGGGGGTGGCSCVSGNCPSHSSCPTNKSLCDIDGISCGDDFVIVQNSSYIYGLNISSNLLEEDNLQYAYLKVYVADTAYAIKTTTKFYEIDYYNNQSTYLLTKYNTPNAIKGGFMKIVAYANGVYYDKYPVDLGIYEVSYVTSTTPTNPVRYSSGNNIYGIRDCLTLTLNPDECNCPLDDGLINEGIDPVCDELTCLSDGDCGSVVACPSDCTRNQITDPIECAGTDNVVVQTSYFYKYVNFNIPFDFQMKMNTCKKTYKSGNGKNSISKLLETNGEILGEDYTELQYKVDLTKIQEGEGNTIILLSGFVTLYLNPTIYEYYDSDSDYYIQIDFYFNNQGKITFSNIRLSPTDDPLDSVVLSLENTPSNVSFDSFLIQNIVKAKITQIYKGEYGKAEALVNANIAKSAQIVR